MDVMPLVSVSLLCIIAVGCFMSRLSGGYCQPSIIISHPQVFVAFECFRNLYTFNILFCFRCHVNYDKKVNRYRNINSSTVQYRKVILFRGVTSYPYLRQFLQKIRNYQLFNVCYFSFIQCDCIVICTTLFACYRCMFLRY